MKKEISELLRAESIQLKKLQEIVKKSIVDEELIIENLLHPPKELISRSDKISDKVATFGGSWTFIISFFAVLLIWIFYNSISLVKDHFDPYPYILMNLILSCVAAIQAPIIMMSQNRKEEKDRKQSENDYLVNLKAELEIRSLHQKVDLLLEEQIKVLFESQAKQMEILENIQAKLNNAT